MSAGGGAAAAAGAGAAAAGGDAGNGIALGAARAAEAQGAEQGQQLNAESINEALGQLVGGQETLRALMMGEEPAGEFDGREGLEGGDGEGLDLGYLDAELGRDDGHADGELAFGEEPADVAEVIAQSVDGYLAEQIQPLAQALTEQQQQIADQQQQIESNERAAAYRQPAAELPAMGDPNVLREVTEAARAVGDVVGLTPQQAMSPHVLRLVYMAGIAAQHAADEDGRGEDPGAAHLEGGGGAPLTGGGQQDDAFGRMLKQKRGSSVLPFGGGG